MRTRGRSFEPIREVLRFLGHQPVAQFHDADRVRWYPVVAEHEFGDPEIAAANNPADRKALLAWLDEPALLNVVPAADTFSRLRIIKHGILAVDFMFGSEIIRVRSIPMTLQRRAHRSVVHPALPSAARNERLRLNDRPARGLRQCWIGRASRAKTGMTSGWNDAAA